MGKAKVTKEIASETVLKWLDHKQVDDDKREDLKASIKAMENAVVYGLLVLDDKFNFQYKLKFPLKDEGGSIVLKELTFKPRMATYEADDKLKHITDPSTNEMLRCYASALASENMGTMKLMDSEDTRISTAIASFFL
jgi:hypothetical protein